MRLVLDTNVLLSGLIFGGICQRVMLAGIESHEVYLSPAIFNEVAEKLAGKFADLAPTRETALRALRDGSRWIEPVALPVPVCRDADDDWILATALAAKADAIVTGDNDLLVLKRYEGIPILSPRQFVELLGSAV